MKPHKISDLELAFPADVDNLIPKHEPGFCEYRKNWIHGDSWGFKLFSDWFYSGLIKLELNPKAGIDKDLAIRHIRAIMGSFSPAHEVKTAACAFLLEHWFESAKWEAK